ncbi:hypothetical protein D3C78_1507420 [compost metagenome]
MQFISFYFVNRLAMAWRDYIGLIILYLFLHAEFVSVINQPRFGRGLAAGASRGVPEAQHGSVGTSMCGAVVLGSDPVHNSSMPQWPARERFAFQPREAQAGLSICRAHPWPKPFTTNSGTPTSSTRNQTAPVCSISIATWCTK